MSEQQPLTIVDHLLICLMEECTEVAKEASKCLRFGLEDSPPTRSVYEPNIRRVVREYHEIQVVFEFLQQHGVCDVEEHGPEDRAAKRLRLVEMLRYAKQHGRIQTTEV